MHFISQIKEDYLVYLTAERVEFYIMKKNLISVSLTVRTLLQGEKGEGEGKIVVKRQIQ